MTIVNIKFAELQSLGRRRRSTYSDRVIEYIDGKIALANKKTKKGGQMDVTYNYLYEAIYGYIIVEGTNAITDAAITAGHGKMIEVKKI